MTVVAIAPADAATLALADGTRLAVRPMLPTDGPALAKAVAGLSPRSRYLRFLAPLPRLTPRHVAQLVDLDGHARGALVVTSPASGAWIGVARWATFADRPATADVAVTVADAWQRRGLGTALLARLAWHAAAQGVAVLEATTLDENVAALALLRGAGFAVTSRSGAARTFVRVLGETDVEAVPA